MAAVAKSLQIPVIDISGPASEESIADQLVNAAKVHGFVYIRNLGRDVPSEDIDRAFQLVRLVQIHDWYVSTKCAASPSSSLHHPRKRNGKLRSQRV